MVESIAEFHIQIVFMICAILGGIMHYLKKYLKGETDVKIYEWYGTSNLAGTVYTVIVFVFTIIGTLAADVVTSETGFWAAMYSGFVTGFAIDSGFNSDSNINKSVIENRNDLVDLFGDQHNNDDSNDIHHNENNHKIVETEVNGKTVIYKPKM